MISNTSEGQWRPGAEGDRPDSSSSCAENPQTSTRFPSTGYAATCKPETASAGAPAPERAVKPLGRKAYGSIPHLPGSRMGPADWGIHEGQGIICTTKARDRHDRVIVTEKLDGACMSVARIGDSIVPLTRAGYHARDGAYEHLRAFAPWVADNRDRFMASLNDGERFCGEWLALAHGTIYDVASPFVVFDLIAGDKRSPHDTMHLRAKLGGLTTAHVLSDGPPVSVEDAMAALGDRGFHGAQEAPEGAVWRVERRGFFDFMAKFVRHEKVDGKYLPDIAGCDPVWLFPLSPSPERGR